MSEQLQAPHVAEQRCAFCGCAMLRGTCCKDCQRAHDALYRHAYSPGMQTCMYGHGGCSMDHDGKCGDDCDPQFGG